MKFFKRLLIGLIFIIIGIFLIGKNIFDTKEYYENMNNLVEYSSEEELGEIVNIDIEDFAGNVKIEKGTKNSIFIKRTGEIINYSYVSGKIKVQSKKYSVFKNEKSYIKITYKDNERLDIDVENFAGLMKFEAAESGLINLENIAGKIDIKVKNNVKIESSNIVGKIFVDAPTSTSSILNVKMENIVGKIEIRK